jgi:predicted transposase YbfD/YdcC
MLKKLIHLFSKIKDFRVTGRTKYTLEEIFTIAFVGIFSGCHGWKEIYLFAVANEYFFKQLLPTLKQIPSVDTICRTISNPKLDKLEMCNIVILFAKEFLMRIKKRSRGRPKKDDIPFVINLDGKTLRGAILRGKDKSNIHIVNAVCELVTLFVMKIEDKSNEIPTYPIVIKALHECGLIRRNVITIDSMGCQTTVTEKICEYGGYYLLGAKGNQPTLFSDIQTIFDIGVVKYPNEFEIQTYTSPADKVAGRIETRKISVIEITPNIYEWLTTVDRWTGMSKLIKVERMIEKTDNSKHTNEVRYYITNMNFTPRKLLNVTVKHWSVETMHNMLDEVENYAEDKSKISRGIGAEMLSIFRKLGLNFVLPYSKQKNESVRSVLNFLKQCPTLIKEILTKTPDEVGLISEWRKRQGRGNFAKTVPI